MVVNERSLNKQIMNINMSCIWVQFVSELIALNDCPNVIDACPLGEFFLDGYYYYYYLDLL